MIVNSDMLRNVALSTKVFKRMVNLRILILDSVCLRGSFKYLSNELRLLWLHNCHLSRIQSDFCFEKLVELNLKDKNIKEYQPNMQHFRCLKILILDDCVCLKKTPNFTGAHSLEKIVFGNCQNLVHVHPSIGSLERLVELHFNSCKKLIELPNSICKQKSLELLSLDECEKLKELPIDLGNLKQLRELRAMGSAISHLPFSLGCLRTLKILNLRLNGALLPSKSKSHVVDILQSHFLSRKARDLVGFLPPSVVNLCSLETLIMLNGMQEIDLPTGLGSLSSFKELDLSGSYDPVAISSPTIKKPPPWTPLLTLLATYQATIADIKPPL